MLKRGFFGMYEDNIFEEHMETAKIVFEMDWEALLDDLKYDATPERLKNLVVPGKEFPFLDLTLQELRVLNLLNEEFYDRNSDPIEFYKSMIGMHGTKMIDGVEYAVMDYYAYHYFDEVMTVEAVDPQGKRCVMIYGLVDNWREVDRQEKEKAWDPGEDDEAGASDGTDMWEHPSLIISIIDFRNEIINRTAFEFRKNGVPLDLQFLSKRIFIEDVLQERAAAYRMPGIVAAFEKLSEDFSDDEGLALFMDEERIRIFYADTDETIEHMMTTCHRIAHGMGKRSGIGEICHDTFLDRIERGLFELIFLVNKPTDELAFVSGVAMQRLDAIRAGELELGELSLDEVNRLMLSFPELLNLDWLFA